MSKLQIPNNWQIFNSAEEVAQEAVKLISKTAKQAIKERGEFHLVTAGGTTPLHCYRLLSEINNSQHDDLKHNWHKWHIYMGDERCLDVNDTARNSFSLNQSWLKSNSIPPTNIHFMPTEKGAEFAKNAYKKIIQPIELFDIVMLGMGEDGHTASLFPDHDYPENESVITELNSPKMPSARISLSYQRLSRSRMVLKLITGVNKQSAIKQWLAKKELPITKVEASEPLGITKVLLDKLAIPEKQL